MARRTRPAGDVAGAPLTPAVRTARRAPTAPTAAKAAKAATVAGRTLTARMVRVAVVWQLAGGVLMTIATTLKRGSTYHDSWSVSPSLALVSVTVVDDSVPQRRSYVSRATAADAPALERDTTYTFSYAIVMRAGERGWAGSGSVTITVGPDGSLMPVPLPAPE